jgi:hypothetical protein
VSIVELIGELVKIVAAIAIIYFTVWLFIVLVGMSLTLANWNRTKTECLDVHLDVAGCDGLNSAKYLICLEASRRIELLYADLQSAASPLRQLAFSMT